MTTIAIAIIAFAGGLITTWIIGAIKGRGNKEWLELEGEFRLCLTEFWKISVEQAERKNDILTDIAVLLERIAEKGKP